MWQYCVGAFPSRTAQVSAFSKVLLLIHEVYEIRTSDFKAPFTQVFSMLCVDFDNLDDSPGKFCTNSSGYPNAGCGPA